MIALLAPVSLITVGDGRIVSLFFLAALLTVLCIVQAPRIPRRLFIGAGVAVWMAAAFAVFPTITMTCPPWWWLC